MKKTILLSLLTTCASLCLYAQTPDFHFGKVSLDELKMTGYAQDSDARAVYLYEADNLIYQITNDIVRYKDYCARIKILKPEGVDQADVSILFRTSTDARDMITGINAAAYNLVDGKIVKSLLKKQYIFTEKVNDDYNCIKFSIPDVREGTVIEYKYRRTSPLITDIPPLIIQHDIPVAFSYMTAAIPEFFRFALDTRGYVPLSVKRETSTGSVGSGTQSFTYTINNVSVETSDVPALKREPFVWCLDDFRTMVDFELSQIAIPGQIVQSYTTTWERVNDALQQSSFDTHCRLSNPYKEEVKAIVAAGGTPLQTAQKILHLVQSKIKWNETYHLFSQGPRAAANQGEGSSADINFILMAALKDAGLKVTPILLSPRSMGRLSYVHPTLDDIHAFVLRLTFDDGTQTYLDGTNSYADINVLPTDLSVDRARVYGIDDESGWCDLSHLTTNIQTTYLNLKLNAEGMLTGECTEQETNQAALRAGEDYGKAKSREEYIAKMEKEQNIEISDLDLKGVGTDTLIRKYQISLPASASNEYIYLNATVLPFMSTNTLNAQSRILPVEFSMPVSYSISCSIALPEGYTVEELPKNVQMTVNKGGVGCRYLSGVQGSTLQINFRFTLDRLIYLPSEFPDLNTFYGLVADLSNSRIVLHKTAE